MVRPGATGLVALAAMLVAMLPGLAAADETVSVDLAEFSVTPSTANVDAGTITFDLNNVGSFPHEFLVIRTDLAPDALPATDGEADEAALDVVAQVEAFDAGTAQTLDVDLGAGNYVLICNVKVEGFPGHYGSGMFTALTVNPAPAPADGGGTDGGDGDSAGGDGAAGGAGGDGAMPTPPVAGNAGLLTPGGGNSAVGGGLLAMLAVALVLGGRAFTARGATRR